MAKEQRLQIGLIFSYLPDWIAGSYYIMNLIEALKTLPTAQQPHICLFVYQEKDIEPIRTLAYPFISYHVFDDAIGYNSNTYSIVERLINKISLMTTRKIVIDNRPKNLAILFPNPPKAYFFDRIAVSKKVHWIPDFQERYLPHFFSPLEVENRGKQHQKLADLQVPLVFSSYNALQDFQQFYPEATNKTAVLQFAVTHPNYQVLDSKTILQKFSLPTHYFFAPNQFWVHKNHKVVIKAVQLLKERGIECVVAFSGKEHDYRNLTYSQDLKDYVNTHDLANNIRFLGFLDRAEQLRLMKEAMAVIQPSLFEGWSTVIEDAKAMNQCIVASNLSVHQEQLREEGNYFDPYQPESLAMQLEKVINKESVAFYTKDYTQNVQKFALDFIQILRNL
ncbi:MAG: glycosyltransferase family 4 protein [Thermoflexibacteraceae bacterium]